MKQKGRAWQVRLSEEIRQDPKAGYETMGSLLENMETIAKTQFTKAQTDAIAENIAIAWYNAGTNRMNATTAADHVANELFKTTGELDIKQKQLLKDWIYQGVHAGVALLEGVTDLVKIKEPIVTGKQIGRAHV